MISPSRNVPGSPSHFVDHLIQEFPLELEEVSGPLGRDLRSSGLKLEDPLLNLGEGDDGIPYHGGNPVHEGPILGRQLCRGDGYSNESDPQCKGDDLPDLPSGSTHLQTSVQTKNLSKQRFWDRIRMKSFAPFSASH